jgi:hypothetical protein
MLKKIRELLIVLAFASSAGVNAAIIDFDDLSAADGLHIPQRYEGFSWLGGDGTMSWVNNASATIDAAGAHSGTNYTWSDGGQSLLRQRECISCFVRRGGA